MMSGNIRSANQKEAIYTDFSVSHNISTGWVMNDFHFHDNYEIYYALSDNIKYFVENRIYDVHKGDIFVFNNMDLHRTLIPEDIIYERYLVLFKPELIRTLNEYGNDLLECFHNRDSSFSHAISLSKTQQETMLSLLKKAEYYCSNNVYGQEIYKVISLCEILLFINDLYKTAGIISNPKKEDSDDRVNRLISYIHDNISSDLSLDVLAEKFYLNKHYLGSLFKKATGFTINEYTIKYKVLKAKQLLKGNATVSEIGEAVGYSNLSHFIRVFKTHTGISPKQFSLRQKKFPEIQWNI